MVVEATAMRGLKNTASGVLAWANFKCSYLGKKMELRLCLNTYNLHGAEPKSFLLIAMPR